MESKSGQRTLRDYVTESERTSEEMIVVRPDCQQKGHRTDRCADAEPKPSTDFRTTFSACANPYRQHKKPRNYCGEGTNREYKSQRCAREEGPQHAFAVLAAQREIDRGRRSGGSGDVVHVRAGERDKEGTEREHYRA